MKAKKRPKKNEFTRVDGLSADDEVTIMVEFPAKPTSGVLGSKKSISKKVNSLSMEHSSSERKIERQPGRDIEITQEYYLLFNGIAFCGTFGEIELLNKLDGITAFAATEYAQPKMDTSTETIGATEAWESGYTGKGTAVAIIDTGVKVDHEAFSVAPPYAKYTTETLTGIFEEYGSLMHCKQVVDSLYYSEKIPFAYDYYYAQSDGNRCGN